MAHRSKYGGRKPTKKQKSQAAQRHKRKNTKKK